MDDRLRVGDRFFKRAAAFDLDLRVVDGILKQIRERDGVRHGRQDLRVSGRRVDVVPKEGLFALDPFLKHRDGAQVGKGRGLGGQVRKLDCEQRIGLAFAVRPFHGFCNADFRLLFGGFLRLGFFRNGVAVVLCDKKGMPHAMLQNLDGHNLQGEFLRNQVEVGEVLRKQLWKQIVEAKIRNRTEGKQNLRTVTSGARKRTESDSKKVRRFIRRMPQAPAGRFESDEVSEITRGEREGAHPRG